jgi:predicted nucleic acid-binding protein
VGPAPHVRVTAALRKRRTKDLYGSVVTRYELRYGASLRQDAERFWALLQREILPVVADWLPVTAEIAERGGEISAELRRKGQESGDLDPLLAATAIVHSLVLVTRNMRHFEPIEGLRIENWFSEN